MAVLRALARRLGRDEEAWGLAGLLHDIDIEDVGGDLSRHGLEARPILEKKEKAFAASVNREIIMECEKIGLSLDEFAGISVAAMQEIADRIGL